MHRLVPGVALALLAASCHAAATSGRVTSPIEVNIHPTPLTEVTEGPVHALIPHHWMEAPLVAADGSLREGLMASPDLHRWRNLDGTVPGMEAAWVDSAKIGIPTNFFYLAAKWPVLPKLAGSETCRPSFEQVIVDHRPAFNRLHEGVGDFAARASGTCRENGHVNRWAYFVAAPSYGPERRVGLRDSGLYMVVAVMPDGPKVRSTLQKVLYDTRFGHASVRDLVLAARQSARLG